MNTLAYASRYTHLPMSLSSASTPTPGRLPLPTKARACSPETKTRVQRFHSRYRNPSTPRSIRVRHSEGCTRQWTLGAELAVEPPGTCDAVRFRVFHAAPARPPTIAGLDTRHEVLIFKAEYHRERRHSASHTSLYHIQKSSHSLFCWLLFFANNARQASSCSSLSRAMILRAAVDKRRCT